VLLLHIWGRRLSATGAVSSRPALFAGTRNSFIAWMIGLIHNCGQSRTNSTPCTLYGAIEVASLRCFSPENVRFN
jgi:hypothetical protein